MDSKLVVLYVKNTVNDLATIAKKDAEAGLAFVKKISKNKKLYDDFVEFQRGQIEPYVTQLKSIVLEKKLTKKKLAFLNEISFLGTSPEDAVFHFKEYETESKNTRCKIAEHLLKIHGSIEKQKKVGGIDNLVTDLMGNPDIMSIANDISKQIEDEHIDPQELLSGILTGKIDPRLANLMDTVKNKVSSKLSPKQIQDMMKNV